MPTYLVTMERPDRRTAMVTADSREQAAEQATHEFDWADEDPLTEHRAITIIDVTMEAD